MKTTLMLTGCMLAPLALGAGAARGFDDRTRIEPALPSIGRVAEKIVGGSVADQGRNRWITSLQLYGEHFCGGALVAPDWVMTAAHCVITESAAGSAFSVWVGGHDLRFENQGVRRDVTQIILHPNYNDYTVVNDIALVRLAAPVPDSIAPVSLADAATMGGPAAPNQPVVASGWGALSEDGQSPDALHEVVLPIVSNSTCNSPESYGGEINANQICAGLRNGGKDSCYGDSGGPLWLEIAGRDIHVGITSWGEGCAQPDKYGVYTRTASYAQWVAQHTGYTPDPADPPDAGSEPPDSGSQPPAGQDPGSGGDGQCPAPADGDGNVHLLFTDSFETVSGLRDQWLHFAIDVPAGSQQLVVETAGGSGDVDLYVAHERRPTISDYDYSPFLDGNDERVKVSSPSGGRWYIGLHGYDDFEDVNLKVRIQ